MPSSSRSTVPVRPAQAPAQAPAGPTGGNAQSRLGNGAVLERLHTGPAAAAAMGAFGKVRGMFDLDARDVGELAGATDVGPDLDQTAGGPVAGAGDVAQAGDGPAVAGPVAGPGEVAPAGGVTAPQPAPKATPKEGTMTARVYAKHAKEVTGRSTTVSPAQAADLEAFVANWNKNKARYEAVAAKAGVPAALVAAIHWRESTGDFGTYLHQGDKLGKAAVNVPKDIPLFTVWEDAAVHALTMSDKKKVHDDLGMDKDTKDAASMATYAEFYNGLGYDAKKKPSPYVYSGTDNYAKGKYVSDGVYSKTTKDQQLGVMKMMDTIGGTDTDIKDAPAKGATGWDTVVAGRALKRGSKGTLVKDLQARLAKAGFPCGDDGKFGKDVETAVKAFQKANKLSEDGVVGKDVGARLADVPAPVAPTPAGPAAAPAGPAAPVGPAGPSKPAPPVS